MTQHWTSDELEAAYRFCDNDGVVPEKILKPHFDATTKRCQVQKVVLCAQDTTELDFSRPQQQVLGAGPLDAGPRRGAFAGSRPHLNQYGVTPNDWSKNVLTPQS